MKVKLLASLHIMLIGNVHALNNQLPFKKLMQAIDQNNTPAMQNVLHNSSIDPFELSSALMHATKKGLIESMNLLIDAGADVNIREGSEQPRMGQTPLAWAIHQKSLPAVELLIKRGADVNALVSGISSEGLEVRSPSNIRNNPILKFAIVEGAPIDIIKLLIESGADINHNKDDIYGKDVPTWTPLMLAAYHGRPDIVELLLLRTGINTSLKNKRDNNKTAIDYAREKKREDIATMIEQHKKSDKLMIEG